MRTSAPICLCIFSGRDFSEHAGFEPDIFALLFRSVVKQFGIAILVALGLILLACGGGSSSSNTVTGNWTATLTNTDGTTAFAFTTSLSQSNGTMVTGANLTFTTSTGCFTSAASQTGSFVLSGNLNGNLAGAFQLTITSATPSGNTLTLQGTVNNNTVTGTWTLAGLIPGCTGSGNFTMTRM